MTLWSGSWTIACCCHGRTGGFMAKVAAAPPKMTLGQLWRMKLKTVDALFVLGAGLVAAGMVVGIAVR